MLVSLKMLTAMSFSWNLWLVGLSVLIATIGSFTALTHAQRMRQSTPEAATNWMFAGGITLGMAIWSMHFIGMLAIHLPISVSYDLTLTLLSVLPAVAAALLGFKLLRQPRIRTTQILFSSLLMGLGISVMHYTGMAALKMSPAITYDPLIFSASVLIAVLASAGALLTMYEGERFKHRPMLRFVLGAIIMGSAISGMHYLAMLGVQLAPNSLCLSSASRIAPNLLGIMIFTISFFWFSGGLLATLFDQRMERQNTKALMALELAHHNLQCRASQQAEEMTQSLRESEERLSMTLRCAPDAVFICQTDGQIVYINDHVTHTLGYTPDDLQGTTFFALVPQDWQDAHQHSIQQVLQGDGRHVFDTYLVHKNGLKIAMELNTVLLPNNEFYASCRDIRERKMALRALDAYQEKLQSLLNSMAEGMYGMDEDGNCTFVNPAFLSLLGFTHHKEIVGKNIHQLIHHSHPDGSSYPSNTCRMHLAYQSKEKIHVDDEVFWRKDGSYIPVEYWCYPLFKGTDVTGSVVTFLDISERKRTELHLRQSESSARSALQELEYQKYALDQHAVVDLSDVDGNITYVNEKFCALSGYSEAELIGQNHRIINSGYHPQSFFQEMYNTITKGDVWSSEICNRSKSGQLYWVIATVVPFLDMQGKPTQYIAIRTDITQRKAAEEHVHQLAFFDALTHLPNRRLLWDRLHQALASSQRTERYGAVLFLDLDHFKTLNDSQGHDIGDMLLKQVAERLQGCINLGDSVARLGGDEFVIVLESLSKTLEKAAAQVEHVAEKICATINQPFQLDQLIHHTTPSIGITLFKGTQYSVDDLLKQADIAMYQSKAAGRNTFYFYEPAMQTALNTRITLEHELRQALIQQQFLLYYQIQTDEAGLALGAEALIRWQHPQRGMISPAEFIPVLEETELIVPIGLWVLRTACLQLKQWENQPLTDDLVIAVNISAKQFHKADFVLHVHELLRDTGARANRIKLELTESMLLADATDAIAKMHELKEMGIRFSMDDFGTGYSSLQYLKLLPLDQIKVDQSFVRDITTDPNDAAIVQAIIAITQALDLDVIAEGVETQAQKDFLSRHGCHTFQGYLFGKPLPLNEFEASIRHLSQAA